MGQTFAPAETPSAVLRAIEAVDWSRLRHLRGSATDVPGLLRGLTASDDDVRRHALRTLGARILPFYDGIDGAVCEVTSHVVPYLARLAATEVRGSAEILVLLRRIATVAWDRDPFPAQLPPPGHVAVTAIELRSRIVHAREDMLANMARRVFVPPAPPQEPRSRLARAAATVRDASAALFRHFDPVAAELLYGHRAHLALARSLPLFFDLLGHPMEDVRTEAARLIERLAQSAARPDDLSVRIVTQLETERDELVIAHLVLALGHTGDRHARALLEAFLEARDPMVCVLAAVSLPSSTGDASPRRRIEILIQTLAAGEGPLSERYELAAARALADDVARALLSCDPKAVGPLMLAVLAESKDRDLPESFLEVLLEITFPDSTEPMTPTALTRDQRLVLRRLSTSTEKLRGKDRDFTSRLAAKGLPTDARQLERFFSLN